MSGTNNKHSSSCEKRQMPARSLAEACEIALDPNRWSDETIEQMERFQRYCGVCERVGCDCLFIFRDRGMRR